MYYGQASPMATSSRWLRSRSRIPDVPWGPLDAQHCASTFLHAGRAETGARALWLRVRGVRLENVPQMGDLIDWTVR
jgi:hypothetical protein